MILQDVSPFVQDIIVTIQVQRQKRDTGPVINGEQTHQSIINRMPHEKSNQGSQTPNHTSRSK